MDAEKTKLLNEKTEKLFHSFVFVEKEIEDLRSFLFNNLPEIKGKYVIDFRHYILDLTDSMDQSRKSMTSTLIALTDIVRQDKE